jgi:serine/threonine-protein kinase
VFTESDQAIAPGARVGPYRVLHRLAVGGMAELFLAHAAGPAGVEKLVVLKQILPDLAEDPEFVELFLNEARLASALSHPNIVHVLDVGSAARAYFLVMEYVHGRNVAAILREASQRGEVPLVCALSIVMEVAAAVHYAHQRADSHGRPLGIVHRDVTPSNVLVSSDGAVKLTDFGIAKAAAQASRTRATAMKGKVGYMAPEQARSQAVDARTDVFALGVLLYELTTCRRCFSGDSDYVTLNRIVAGDYVRPSKIIGSYPADLEAIVRSALQPDPGDRYPSAAAMLAELERLCSTQGLQPSPTRLARYVDKLLGFPPYPTVVDDAPSVVPRDASQVPTVGLRVRRTLSSLRPRGRSGWALAGAAAAGATVAVAAMLLATPSASEPPTGDAAAERDVEPARSSALTADAATETPSPAPREPTARAEPPPSAAEVEADLVPSEHVAPGKARRSRKPPRAKRSATRGETNRRDPMNSLFPP